MNKMKKLLSVILAVVLAFSALSVLGSAARTPYKTVADLEELDAYSPYGQVTRLSAEERMSIVFDFLDPVLAGLNINMGTIDIVVASLYINITSVDELCKTLDSIAGLSDFLWGLAKGLLGDLQYLDKGAWDVTGMTRDTYDQLTIVKELAEFLAAQTELITNVFDGLELGLVSSFVSGLDLTGINEFLTDLPGLVKGMLFPMFERWDQTLDEVNMIENALTGNGNVISVLDTMVGNFFTRPMSMTTVKADATGMYKSNHTFPTADGYRRKFALDSNGDSITVYQYYTQSDVDASEDDDITAVGYMNIGTYYRTKEVPDWDGSDYVYVLTEVDEVSGQEVKTTLKYYEDDSYWLKSFQEDGGTISISTETGINLLYKMIPYVFDEMAPTVINGSLKKLLAGLFGVKWTNLGLITDEAVLAKVQALPGYDASLEVFGEQGDYLWEWSAFDYIANGEATNKDDYFYYRYEDQIFVGDATNANDMIEIMNWDFRIDPGFMDKYIPANSSSTSEAGYTRILYALNTFIYDVANEVLDLTETGITVVAGDNTNLVTNVKNIAQGIVGYAPETIFGTTINEAGEETHGAYYDLIMGDDNDLILTGLAALAIDALAPQMHLPDADSIAAQQPKLGALLAAMVRELATQILPSVDYDALIYTDYTSGTFLAGKDNSYWLDVLLTMGADMGFKYLRAFSDMGEDQTAWTALGYTETKTYSAADMYITVDGAQRPRWEAYVDYIIDWALTVADGSYTWNMNNLVEEYLGGLTVDMATNQNPWLKLDAIIDNLLFIDQFTSTTDLEVGLRGTILNLVDLKWEKIFGTGSGEVGLFDIPSTSKLVTTNLLDALSLEIRDLINGLFKNIGGGSYYFIPESITNLNQFANQDNLVTIVSNLVGALDDAYNNGLLNVALPFLNFFLGWKVDPQVIADPEVGMNNYWSRAFSYCHEAGAISWTWIRFRNGSSGMLEKHRDTTTVDHEYEIVIDSVTHNAKINTTLAVDEGNWNEENRAASPYETIEIPLTGTFVDDEAVCLTVEYHYVGKDGQSVGGQLKKNIYTYFTDVDEDLGIMGRVDGDDNEDYTGLANFNKFVFTEDIKDTVKNYMGTINYKSAAAGIVAPDKSFQSISYPDSYPFRTVTISCEDYKYTIGNTNLTLGQTYFTGITDRAEAGWLSTITKDDGSTRGYVYKENSTGTATAEEDMPYGDYHIGAVAVKYGSDSKVIDPIFVHYNDYDIWDVYGKYRDMEITDKDIDSANATAKAAYDKYIAALADVAKYAQYPKKTAYNSYLSTTSDGTTWTTPIAYDGGVASTAEHDYVSVVMPKIEPAIAALESAYADLESYLPGGANSSASGASTADLKTFLDDEAENEVNFQNYEYYEYFNFADLRTFARNLYKGTLAPEIMDTYYIDGSGIREAELDKLIAAETNANIAAAIKASRLENDAQAVADSVAAHNNFVAPEYTELYLDDLVARLEYYRNFALAHPVAADLEFIDREEVYAETNYPITDETAELYTDASWTAYVEAYNTAKAITTSNTPKEVFDAKYDLMVKMKNLLLVAESANENYIRTDDTVLAHTRLQESYATATEILDMNTADLVLTEDAIAAGYTVETALAALLSARGYNYTGEDGVEYNLYADSALEYIENDRPNKSTNWRKMDAADTALQNAIALFDIGGDFVFTAKDGTTGVVEVTSEEGAALTTGYIYGITAGDAVENYITYSDCYVEYVASDLSDTGTVNGTGALVKVYSDAAMTSQIAEYTVIVFGDINGDATITASDYTAVLAMVQAVAYSDVQKVAADVSGATSSATPDITASDYTTVLGYCQAKTPTVNPYVVA